mmetsp:Transcript_33567/g.42270  ORF Transcript_33567/g.42270 Transcript_33567/m.42270 type:complete len:87 (-) Transcript_33567:45-305(-)
MQWQMPKGNQRKQRRRRTNKHFIYVWMGISLALQQCCLSYYDGENEVKFDLQNSYKNSLFLTKHRIACKLHFIICEYWYAYSFTQK